MDNNSEKILNIIKKPSKGAFIYGSFALYGNIDKVNDIDIFNLCEGEHIHERIVTMFNGIEIHEYRMSKDIIMNDIFEKEFGNIHACNFWGPMIPLIKSKEIELLVNIARKEKINDTLLLASFLDIDGFTIDEVIEIQYLIESIFKPYAVNIIKKISTELAQNKNNEFLQQWKKDIINILCVNDFHDITIIQKDDKFFVERKKQCNFAQIYSDNYLNSLRFWKAYLETHEQDWDNVFIQASKHYKDIENIDNYLSIAVNRIINNKK